MNEISIKVISEVGTITTNFEHVKEGLSNICEAYTGLDYTDEQISTARKDVATLRKIKKAIDDKRKEVKKMQSLPYAEFEASCKELTAMLDDVINPILEQIEEATEKKILEKIETLKSRLYEIGEEFPEITSIYNLDNIASNLVRNNPMSASIKKLADGFREEAQKIQNDLGILNDMSEGLPEHAKEEIKNSYIWSGFDLAIAIKTANNLTIIVEQVAEQDEEEVEELPELPELDSDIIEKLRHNPMLLEDEELDSLLDGIDYLIDMNLLPDSEENYWQAHVQVADDEYYEILVKYNTDYKRSYDRDAIHRVIKLERIVIDWLDYEEGDDWGEPF